MNNLEEETPNQLSKLVDELNLANKKEKSVNFFSSWWRM